MRTNDRKKFINDSENSMLLGKAISAKCIAPTKVINDPFSRRIFKYLQTATQPPRAGDFLFQQLSIALMRGNAASLLGSMQREPEG